jgi:hypothetical protein
MPALAEARIRGWGVADCGYGAVAMRGVRKALSSPADSFRTFVLCALRDLRKHGIKADRGGACARDEGNDRANPWIAGAAVRTMPE